MWYKSAATVLEERKRRARDDIDRAAGKARLRFVSPGALVDQEYLFAKEQALEFKATGVMTPELDGVQSWADVEGMTPEEAAEDILATERAWGQVANRIRRVRFEGRKAVQLAATADIEAVRDAYIAQLEAIKPLEA